MNPKFHSSLAALICVALCAGVSLAQSTQPTTRRVENHDESKVIQFTLPDALTLENGKPVTAADTWFNQRRPELLKLFQENIYGYPPALAADLVFDIWDIDAYALGGKATRKQVSIYFNGDKTGPHIDMLIYLPNHAKKPVPTLLCLSFSPLQNLYNDPGIRLMDEWTSKTKTVKPGSDATRGTSKAFQIDRILARGYGFAAIYYQQIEPDFAGGWQYGVRKPLFIRYMSEAHNSTDSAAEPGAIATWAWGASRAMDYLQTDADVDGKHVIMMGQSRLGKTCCWIGASDPRFALIFACNSGRGGASLARRNYGETIGDLARNYGYQFCPNFQKFAADPTKLPVDTHELLGLIAPRPVYLTTGSLDLHSDPHGEFLAAIAAGPIFKLLGGADLGTDQQPPNDMPIFHTIAYSCHTGPHATTPWDWDRALDFADMQFKGKQPTTQLAN